MRRSIPDNAKKVFKGVLFDVYHWDQEMFDGSTATFEAVSRIPSVQIITITKDKKIILLNEEQPHVGSFISVPGGMVERGDTPEYTVEKELMEEVGMKAEEIILWKEVGLGSKIQWSAYYYIAKGCEVVQDAKPECGEKIEHYEVSFEKFLEETQKKEFRNKALSDMVFRMMHTPGELEKFKKLLFD